MDYTSTKGIVIAENVVFIFSSFSFCIILQCPENLKLKMGFHVHDSY